MRARPRATARLGIVELFIANFIRLFATALFVLIFGRVIVSWVDPRGRNQVSAWLIGLTEPILAPVRRVLPPMGMIDLSPTIVLIVLAIIMRTF